MTPLRALSLIPLAASACTLSSARLELPPRDWAADPAILELTRTSSIFALSDPHGALDRTGALLAAHHLIQEAPRDPKTAVWTGGDATLVVVGDLFDKGPMSLEVAELFRTLEAGAAAQGGRVVALLGNHEAEFLANPDNDKAGATDGVGHQLTLRGIAPTEFAVSDDPAAQWLRRRPFAARIGGWFFAHAGNTAGRSIAELTSAIKSAIDAHGYGDVEIIGNDSLLEARNWYTDATLAQRYARAVSAEHIVFGHDPNGLGPRGSIAMQNDGALFRIDCGMAPAVNDSPGVMFEVTQPDNRDRVEALTPDGKRKELWRAP